MAIEYQGPWTELEEPRRTRLQKRYDHEITDGHVLWGASGYVIGKNEGTDDVLIRLADGRFAIVHLTWSERPGGKEYPSADVYASAQEASEAIAFDAIGYD